MHSTTQTVDWTAFAAAFTLACLGLLTMNSFTGDDPFFVRQTIWLVFGVIVFFTAASIDWRFLRESSVAAGI